MCPENDYYYHITLPTHSHAEVTIAIR